MRHQTLIAQLLARGQIERAHYEAGGRIYNLAVLLEPGSEGVANYEGKPNGSQPHRKGDRKAQAMTGIEILEGGTIVRGKANRDTWSRFRDAMFAMVGVTTEEGERAFDGEAAILMMRAISEPVAQLEIGQSRVRLKSEKQLSAAGVTFVRENLHRAAIHFGLISSERMA